MPDEANNNQTIDTLNIDIKVSSLKKSDINKINSLSDALTTLNKALSPTLLNKISKLGNISLIGLGKGIVSILGENKQNKTEKSFYTIPGMANLLKRKPKSTYTPLGKDTIFNINGEKGDKKNDGFFAPIINNLDNFLKKFDVLREFTKNVNESFSLSDDDETEKEKKKKSNNYLLKSFGRIALYRAIRQILSAIANSIKIGVENLAIFDRSFNKTMSSIVSSTQQIQNSIGLMFQPLIEGFAPLLENVSTLFINIANEISRINALQKGTTEYTKINADYAKDYANSLSKASGFAFDTFNVLSSGTGAYYENASVNEASGASGVEQMISNALTNIQEGVIGFVSLVKPIFEGFVTVLSPIIWVLGKIIEGIGFLIEKMPFLGHIIGGVAGAFVILNIAMRANPMGLIITGITILISLIGLLVKNWDKVVSAFVEAGKVMLIFFQNMIRRLAKWAEDFINFFVDGINMLLDAVEDLVRFFGGNVDLGLNRVSFTGGVQYFANGGIASAGSLFVAGESGAELLTNMGGGNTGVTNVEQFEQAMTRSIISSGLLEAVLESGNIYIDSEKVGRKVGQTKAIRNQLNRTNPNLKLR